MPISKPRAARSGAVCGGGVVRRVPGEVSLAELQEAVAEAATKPEVWVMNVFGAEMLCKPCGQRM